MVLCITFPFFTLLFLFNLQPSIAQQQRQQQQQQLTSFNISFSPWLPTQNKVLLSPNSNFTAGFFPIPNSQNLFTFSVWFSKVPQSANPVIWNATTQVNNSGSLVITTKGELLLNDSPFANNASSSSNSTQLVLDNDGNLVFGDWSSFKNPTNTILPNQNFSGIELYTINGKYKFIKSQFLVLNSTSDQYYNTPSPLVSMDDAGKMTMVGGFFLTSDYGDPRLRKMVLDEDGNLKIYSFYPEQQNKWVEVWKAVWEVCTIKGKCGSNAICMPKENLNYTSTYCVCPSGFKANQGGPENGCTRKIPLSSNTKFLRLDYINYTSNSQMNQIVANNFTICESGCIRDTRCLGFGFKYDGTGYCVWLLGTELQYGYWSPGPEIALFLKVDKSESEATNFIGMTEVMQTACPVKISLPLPPKDSNTTTRNIAIICTLFALEFISGVAFFWSFLKRYIKYRDMATTLGLELLPAGGPKRFTYSELKAATNDFSNLIGRGGFGDVYKGELPDHRVVAVKCLKNVAGGDAEFWAEVTIIARMHHLNLVRLWGFCAEKGQRILVYEHIPGGSLDKHLFQVKKSLKGGEFDPNNNNNNRQDKPVLDWNMRYRIALGVARAIAYLHEECLEWVLHCDIKPENILLGDDFCPKISDFGLAKLRKKEDMVTMSRKRGTPGYMAPEWITADPITSKADVYSFGMVLLELVSGVRNFEIQGSVVHSEEWYFPRWAFDKMFKDMRVEDILDIQIKDVYDSRAHFELVNRMVKTAMWCLQDRPELRPTMGKVAKMLEGTVEITEPKKPTIFFLGEE
ncbi:G-type lectin S-receptor-like serine/threonine-protein kinase At1g34300 [Gastrolobium bilobum]|uniref:G-type lectin S-receptor-like serine/threonine-protein kinase At1g34300 n=1 Tax=Gastrolobium bilobum TaxID=150636 RepID=UPI002AAF6EF6|nr:G-type lectin S-receptor-like serine/threonine-protein kinase At1g34300 [Gastrolobium bilobum]